MTTGKKLVRVYTVDETKHGFVVEENITALQLSKEVAKKIRLTDDSHYAIFETRGVEERCMSPEEKPVLISEKWSPTTTTTVLKNSVDPANNNAEFRLVFKKKIFTRGEDEPDAKDIDEMDKHMLYIQALHDVIEGEYPCSPEDAVKLAALQTQVIYGDHNATTHVPGFFGASLGSFIPKVLMPQKPAKEWETLIFKAHLGKKGLPAGDAETDYLNIVKAWPHYGTKYFKNCRPLSKNKLPQKVMIGVNLDGIIIANNKDKDQSFNTYFYADLLSWSTSHNNGAQSTFTFEVCSTNNNDATKYVFETRHADALNDLVQSYVDVLIQMIRMDIGETTSPRE